MPSINHPTSHPDENPLGLRGRILQILGYGASREEKAELEPLLDKMDMADAHQEEAFKEVLGRHHGIAEMLNKLSDPDLTMEESFDIINQLNEKYGLEPELRRGRQLEATFPLPHGAKLHIKLFTELGNTPSFSLSRRA